MLSHSDLPVTSAIEAFSEFGVEAAYFSPTRTGLSKAIIDAHAGIRLFLSSHGVHEFESQPKGQMNKEIIDVFLVTIDSLVTRKMSLYRPETKNGDPRMWVGRLGEYAQAGNLLALIIDRAGAVYVVNCSDRDVLESRHLNGSPLHSLLTSCQQSTVKDELLQELQEICRMGFVDSLREGDTGVGFTLEQLLGISANSRKDPDFKGIELKSGRQPPGGRPTSRASLFSRVPDWDHSAIQSGIGLLTEFGYLDRSTGRKRLYCTVSAKPNAQGLYFSVPHDANILENLAEVDHGAVRRVVQWSTRELHDALLLKHRETFWVKAVTTRSAAGTERFHYVEAVHSRSPMVANFLPLIEAGRVTMDYTLKVSASGAAHDHGYLFKIWARDLPLLFPKPLTYDLRSGADSSA